MKPFRLLLLAALIPMIHATVSAQITQDGVLGEVTEFTHAVRISPQAPAPSIDFAAPAQIEDDAQASNYKCIELGPSLRLASSTTEIAASENTSLPGAEANVKQQYAPTGPNDKQDDTSFELSETAKANAQPLTFKQKKAIIRKAHIAAKEAAKLEKREAARAAAQIPNNSVYNTSKFSLFGQVGIDDQQLGGLNYELIGSDYPTVGAHAYRVEMGTIYQLSNDNSLDASLSYALMNGLEKQQRIDQPSAGQVTESKSTMWLVGIQTGIDHSLLGECNWTVTAGLGLGAAAGGLHLTQRVQEITPTATNDPSIPTPEQLAVVHYDIANVSVTPRLTLRSPEFANGWKFQARAGYQFGKNAMLRVDELASLRNDFIYNPSGITASVGLIAPLSQRSSK